MFLFTLILLLLFAFYGVLIDYYRRAWKAIPYSFIQGAPCSLAKEGAPDFAVPGAPAPSVSVAGASVPGSASLIRTKISVLVPARNEAGNIRNCLESLSRQSYPKDRYEVIVIDDHSTDRTATIVQDFAIEQATATQGGPGLSISCLRLSEKETASKTPMKGKETGPVKAYKKFAIETGIRAAGGELIITTDADCRFHPDWLRTLGGFYEETGAKFIAAPVKIGGDPIDSPGKHREGHSLLLVFQTLDFITLQGITAAAVYKRFHSMCNGANLAYEKKVFYEVDGFTGIDDVPSGDDMLLMHKIYKKYPEEVLFLKNRHAIVSTRPETSWRGFVNQRIRWASKADKYDDKRIFWVLLLVYILNLLFIGLLLASWWNSWYLWLLLILVTAKTAIEFPFVRSVAGFFGQQRLMVYFPALQPFHILYTVVIGWLGKFGHYRWKERKIVK